MPDRRPTECLVCRVRRLAKRPPRYRRARTTLGPTRPLPDSNVVQPEAPRVTGPGQATVPEDIWHRRGEVAVRFALHPTRDQWIAVEDYLREFGRKQVGLPERRDLSLVRCPFCPDRLSVHADASPHRRAHFAHSVGAVCPTMAPAGRPYNNLTPQQPDPESALNLFDAFAVNWQRHYAAAGTLVANLTVDEFLELVEAATDRHSWAYADLPLWAVPYVLVLQRDFPPQRGGGGRFNRRLYFRFWFHHRPVGLDTLWIDAPDRPQLRRVTYQLAPKQRRPTEDDLTGDKSFTVGPALYESVGAVRQLPPSLVTHAETTLARLRQRMV